MRALETSVESYLDQFDLNSDACADDEDLFLLRELRGKCAEGSCLGDFTNDRRVNRSDIRIFRRNVSPSCERILSPSPTDSPRNSPTILPSVTPTSSVAPPPVPTNRPAPSASPVASPEASPSPSPFPSIGLSKLTPGTGFDGETSSPPAFGLSSNPNYSFPTIARFVSVPYRSVRDLELIGVMAFHPNGIEHVSFSVNGGPWTLVRESRLANDGQGETLPAYWAQLDLSNIADGTPLEVRVIATPRVAGKPRLLSGDTLASKESHSLFLVSNAGNSLPTPELWVGPGGSADGEGTDTFPFDSVRSALFYARDTFGSPDGVTIQLKESASPYELPSEGGLPNDQWGPFFSRYVTIQSAPGSNPARVTLTGLSRPRTKGLYRLYNLSIDGTESIMYSNPVAGESIPVLWLDRVSIDGGHRTEGTFSLVRDARTYVTNSVIREMPVGFNGFFIRNSLIDGIEEDAFRLPWVIINAEVRDMEVLGTYEPTREPHPDMIQGFGGTISNGLVYGLRAVENINAQTWSYTFTNGVAVVNSLVDGGNTNIGTRTAYLLFRQSTSLNSFIVRGFETDFPDNNFVFQESIIGSVLTYEDITIENSDHAIASRNSHYVRDFQFSERVSDTIAGVAVDDLFENYVGLNFTPRAAVLRNRVSEPSPKTDMLNKRRGVPAAVGALVPD